MTAPLAALAPSMLVEEELAQDAGDVDIFGGLGEVHGVVDMVADVVEHGLDAAEAATIGDTAEEGTLAPQVVSWRLNTEHSPSPNRLACV